MKENITVDLLDYLDGKLTITGIVAAAQEHNSNIVFSNVFVMKEKEDRRIVGPILKLIYHCTIEDIEVFVPVGYTENGKHITKLERISGAFSPGPDDIIFEMEYADIYSGTWSVEDIAKMCKKMNATVLQENNSPEKITKKDAVFFHVLSKELRKHNITIYDPLDEKREKKSPKEKTVLAKKENIETYISNKEWNNKN